MTYAAVAGGFFHGHNKATGDFDVTSTATVTYAAHERIVGGIIIVGPVGVVVSSITDPAGNTYVLRGTRFNDGFNAFIQMFDVADAIAMTSQTVTMHISTGGLTASASFVAQRYTGLGTTAPVAATGAVISGPGTGADAITTGAASITPGAAPAMIVGLVCDLQTAPAVITAGTALAFTMRGQDDYTTESYSLALEDARVTTTTAVAATAGGAAQQYDRYLITGGAYAEPGVVGTVALLDNFMLI